MTRRDQLFKVKAHKASWENPFVSSLLDQLPRASIKADASAIPQASSVHDKIFCLLRLTPNGDVSRGGLRNYRRMIDH